MHYKTPFKERSAFHEEIHSFLDNYGNKINQEVKKISTLFEITCYNYVIEYYENLGFNVIPRNPKGSENTFIYKTSPSGNLEKYSYFEATIQIQTKHGPNVLTFNIRQNV